MSNAIIKLYPLPAPAIPLALGITAVLAASAGLCDTHLYPRNSQHHGRADSACGVDSNSRGICGLLSGRPNSDTPFYGSLESLGRVLSTVAGSVESNN